ncbi:MAG: DUF3488 and transglutaminase-like domain-containing protein [Acidobacteria bacterium]|nr:DUF3488 and transglutaminase-like domain-containing protein [Acidobacteriota bacterium]
MKRTDSARLEQLALAALAALPFYFSYVVSMASVAGFHLALLFLAAATLMGRPVRIPAPVLAASGVLYLLFFPFDVLVFSRGLIAPSSHLLFFIALYQAIESEWRSNGGQRLFVTFLIFVTVSATSTHSTIMIYMIGFLILTYRELMRLSRETTHELVRGSLEEEIVPLPRTRLALILTIVTMLVALAMFPFLPRLRDPFVRGVPSLSAARSTGISDVIDFEDGSVGSEDPEVVARVWAGSEDALFLPIRLRAAVYDTWLDGRWISSKNHTYQIRARRGSYVLAAPGGRTGSIEVQQRRSNDRRIFLPAGTWAVSGLDEVIFSKFDGVPVSVDLDRGPLTFTAELSERTQPLAGVMSGYPGYPQSPAIRALAEEIVGTERDPIRASRLIERHLANTFTYLSASSPEIGTMTVDDFLLRVRKGHCEYFAAGMVVLLESIGIPSRIVGGFYGGDLNRLSGYWIIRVRNAHAWVEVEADGRWNTFDPTPADLRPGNAGQNSLFALVAMAAESFSYFWDRWILTYGASDQLSLAELVAETARGWLSSIRQDFPGALIRSWIPFLVVGLGVAILIGLMLSRRRRGSLWEQTLVELDRMGVDVEDSATEGEVLALVEGSASGLSPMLRSIVRFQQIDRYSGRAADAEAAASARRALAQLRRLSTVS